MYEMSLTFADNDSYNDEKLLYSNELAILFYDLFYKPETYEKCYLPREIKHLYELVTIVENLTQLSKGMRGAIKVEEAIRKMSESTDRNRGTDIYYHGEEMIVSNLQNNVKAIILWSCELYCKTMTRVEDKDSEWNDSMTVFQDFLESMESEYFHFRDFRLSLDDSYNKLIELINKRGEIYISEKDKMREELRLKDDKIRELEEQLKIATTDIPDAKNIRKQNRIYIAKKVLKELEADFSFPKQTQWATILNAITDISTKTCNNILSEDSFIDTISDDDKKRINSAFKIVGLNITL